MSLEGSVKRIIKLLFGVMAGSGIAQLVNMLSIPVVAKFYGPLAFGVLSGFMVIRQIFGPISLMRLDQRLLFAESDLNTDDQASAMVYLSLYTSLSVVVLVALMDAFQLTLISNFNPTSALILFALLFGAGLFAIVKFICLVHEDMKVFMIGSFIMALSCAGLRLWPNAYEYTNVEYLAATAALTGLGVSFFCVKLLGWGGEAWKGGNALALVALRSSSMYVKTRLQIDLLNQISRMGPAVVIPMVYGVNELAMFWLVYRMVGIPFSMASEALNSAVLRMFRGGATLSGVRVVGCGTLALTPIVAICVWFVASVPDFTYARLLGEEWAGVSDYVVCVTFWCGAAFVMTPSVALVNALGLEAYWLRMSRVQTLLRCIIICVCPFYVDAVSFVKIFGSLNGLLYLLQSIVYIRVSRKAL